MNPYQLPDTLANEIDEYEKAVISYLKEEITGVKMKVIRIPFGCYEQRDNEKYMVRVRLSGGSITPAQLLGVAGLAAAYSSAPLHFTTRQDIQIHSVELSDTIAILHSLYDLGLTTRGTGGNTVRGISASWDAGINAGHPFDVSPYAEALTTRMISESDSWSLPRKFKIAFSGGEDDSAFATVNDLGFITKTNATGERGFAVSLGGGMGAHPRIGLRVRDFIPAYDVGAYARAAKLMFNKYGNRKNKRKARLRYVRDAFGDDGFRIKFEEELSRVLKEGYTRLDIDEENPVAGAGFIVVPFFLGDGYPSLLSGIARLAMELGDKSLRILPNQNLLVRNIPVADTTKILDSLKKLNAISPIPRIFGNAVACAGASTCKLGIGLSRNLLEAIMRRSKDDGTWGYPEIQDVSIKISGCPNSCGQHAIADIGFAGAAKRINERQYPAYTFYAGARIHENNPGFGAKITTIPAKRVPAFVSALFGFIRAKRNAGERFSDFVDRIKPDLISLAESFTRAPEVDEEPGFYKDWGSEDYFSLAKKTEGECSAGLVDLIEFDLSTARNALYEFASAVSGGQTLLAESVTSSARALLVAKGVEAKTQGDVFAMFRKYFIGTHIDSACGGLLVNVEKGQPVAFADAESFFHAIESLYERMDNTLRFPEIGSAQAMEPEVRSGE